MEKIKMVYSMLQETLGDQIGVKMDSSDLEEAETLNVELTLPQATDSNAKMMELSLKKFVECVEFYLIQLLF